MLSDTPRQKLAAMIALDGVKVASDAKLCEALLRDYCGEYRVEIAALTAAVRWGVPKSLGEAGLVPPASLRAQLARRLQENHGLAEESAYWAVDAWASVLGHPFSGVPSAELKRNSDMDVTAPWSSIQEQASAPPQQQSPPASPRPQTPPKWQPPPLPKSPVQAQSPVLPPLPKPPSEPHSPPPPKLPDQQARSPVLPQLPNSSQPLSPVLPPLPGTPPRVQSTPPATLDFLPAAQAFENRQITTHLRVVQTYLALELKTRNAAALQEELRLAGVQPLTARRLVSQVMRASATRQFWIAVAIFMACLLLMLAALGPARVDSQTTSGSVVMFIAAGAYLLYRGVRLIGTF